MKIGFIESLKYLGNKSGQLDVLSQLRYAGKRTTLLPRFKVDSDSQATQKRMTPLESFKNFTKKILPQMEQTIEINILKNQFKHIKNQDVRDDLIQSYLKRRVQLYSVEEQVIDEIKKKEETLSLPPSKSTKVFASVPINELDQEDIGTYIEFPLQDLEKYFKNGQFFGDYISVELPWTKKFSLMATEESLKIIQYLNNIQQTLNKPVDYQALFSSANSPEDVEYILDDDQTYPTLFRDLSKSLLVSLQKYRSDKMFERLFSVSSIFDLLVRIVIWEFPKNNKKLLNYISEKQQNQQKIFEQMLAQIDKKGDREQSNPQFLAQFLRQIGSFELKITTAKGEENYIIDLTKDYCKFPRRVPKNMSFGLKKGFLGFNSGCLLYGERGSGKSGVLGFASMWAHKNKWIVATVPSCYKWTQVQSTFMRHHKTGLFVQNELAKEWLDTFRQANRELISNIPIQKEIYGKYNFSGVHDRDPEPVPNIFYKRRKAYFKDHEKFLYPEEIKLNQEMDKKMETRLSERLKNPKTLLELVTYGIDNEWFACNTVYELLEQLYNLDSHCVLVVLDEYNYMFRPSIYPSFRYANDTDLKSYVPPYHLSLCRAFINFNGHLIKNGFKLAASSNKRLYKHNFNGKKILLPKGYDHEVNGLPLDDFRMMCEYYLQNKLWQSDSVGENSQEYLWMQTQGNWHEAQQYILYHHLDTALSL